MSLILFLLFLVPDKKGCLRKIGDHIGNKQMDQMGGFFKYHEKHHFYLSVVKGSSYSSAIHHLMVKPDTTIVVATLYGAPTVLKCYCGGLLTNLTT